ncbi:hypothetical protein DCS_04249 [Drechmeria coniospora]|uniref:Protein farnesyltransferase/geranylgeranyltransferase type-1 subunit alpha n=1 Tax=Drechmeria coniospora TaxID=98403 RepID=A0A151GJQ3_DRECN|nr:hypothetical protein DCS_04249 [Drechmeria coniospora]KYK57242.1 hypothetical protein DCS_04249 [Drechmeria coniospora]ODA79129.1 hypothetical protein RJ55_04721 [Drechmeria coniospora]
MPPKQKAAAKACKPATQAAAEPVPETVEERSRLRFYQTNPVEQRFQDVGLPGLTPTEKKTYAHSRLIIPVTEHQIPLSSKAEREFWKQVTKEAFPTRRLRKDYSWGKDRNGRDFGTYKPEDFQQHTLKQASLTALDIHHRSFLARRDIARRNGTEIAEEELEAEKKRRKEMAALKRELYGDIVGPLTSDPEWDDVIPIPSNEAEDALARIAYPDDYAEAVSYLRAVMAAEECSPRCLRLTELVIAMNPAHYTVWLYRFQIVKTLQLPVVDEIQWLNEVALENLKNYQIWHHRQLLMDYHYPRIASDAEVVKKLGKSEGDFISTMLVEDTKNYHVWSYRQYLVEKLGLWTPNELGCTQNMIEDDVRNNSAWAHRFFVVFSDPKVSTKGLPSTAHDPKVPDSIIDREVSYAKEKITSAPQNQSGWNYLRGVLAKGGRSATTVSDFADQFVSGLGEEDEKVQSSHALDLLSEVYSEKKETTKAKLCLQRLWEKWDPVREGYWKHRASELERAT